MCSSDLHRLRGILKKIGVKKIGIIDIEDEETPTDRSPEYQYEEDLDRGTPEVDPTQQHIYNYFESLEKRASKSRGRTPSPQKSPIEVLRRDKYELEVLNRHIKNENEILREQFKLKSNMNTTLSLQMEKLYKALEQGTYKPEVQIGHKEA